MRSSSTAAAIQWFGVLSVRCDRRWLFRLTVSESGCVWLPEQDLAVMTEAVAQVEVDGAAA